MTDNNPFKTEHGQKLAAADRIQMVRTFDAEQCRSALGLFSLQTTVEKALRARLKQLQRQGKA